MLNTNFFTYKDLIESECVKTNGLGCCIANSYCGELRLANASTVWPRFSHTRGLSDEG